MNHFNLITSLILLGLTVLCFWLPYKHGNKQIGIITGIILSLIIAWTILAELEFLVIFIWPFIFVFQIKLLAEHNIELIDNFKILNNESGGFMDYAHTLKIQISDSDKSRIAKEIKESKGFLKIVDFKNNYPSADYETFEKLNFETENYLNREYYVKEPMEDGTIHFHFQLSKTENELQYIGTDE